MATRPAKAAQSSARSGNRCGIVAATPGSVAVPAGKTGLGIVGADGAEAAWLLTQHGDIAVQRRCLPLLRAAVESGSASPEHLAALVVFVSIIVHGLTDTPGANWIARHAERVEAEAEEVPAAQPA